MGSNSKNSQHLTAKGSDKGYRCIFVGCSIFLWIVSPTQAAPTTTTTETIVGYLSTATSRSSAKDLYAKTLTPAIEREYKVFTGLDKRIIGHLDSETKHLMTLPRCAAPGKFNDKSSGRPKRYFLLSSWFRKRQFTYTIHNYPHSLSDNIVDYEIARAFAMWSKAIDFTFTRIKNGSADINISFLKGDHGDIAAFDGSGGVIAHAVLPTDVQRGTVHFDAAEYWTSGSKSGINLFQTAAHEFGHILGLLHSDVRTAIMRPYYIDYDPNFQLDQDDIRSIQFLYKVYDLVITSMEMIQIAIDFFFQANICVQKPNSS